MSNCLLNTELNDHCKMYLVKGNEYLIKNIRNYERDYNNIVNRIGEHLLYHDGISFLVNGENIPVAVLIQLFGIKGLESLLEQNAIHFIQDNQLITYLVDDIRNVNPLQSGFQNSIAHDDLEKSTFLGLNWLSEKIPRKQRRALTRKIVKYYDCLPKDISANAVSFGQEGYNSDLFKNIGLPKESLISELDLEKRKKLCSLADQCKELAILSHFNLSTLNEFELFNIHNEKIEQARNIGFNRVVTDKIFSIENLPNYSDMIKDKIIDFRDIPDIHSTNNSIKFRKWIEEVSDDIDASEISKQYIDAICKSSIIDKNFGKFLRTLTVTGVSALVGGIAGGSIGAIYASAISNAASFGVSLLDTYLIGEVTKGWNPRYYFDKDIRKRFYNNSK